MKLLRIDDAALARSTASLFEGVVYTQRLTQDLSQQLAIGVVSFRDGARNKLHAHDGDQVLVITEGEGIVATEAEERRVSAGDVAFIPAGERHWHGAQPGRSMTHLSIVATGR